ncbi:MAG: hypothetical protein AB7O62_00450 [Pirellulales bacterium]
MTVTATLSRQEVQQLCEGELRRRGMKPRGPVVFIGTELHSAVCEVEPSPHIDEVARWFAEPLRRADAEKASEVKLPPGPIDLNVTVTHAPPPPGDATAIFHDAPAPPKKRRGRR